MSDEAVDHRKRVAGFLERFGRDRNLTLPPLSEDGVGSTGDLYSRVLRGLDGLDDDELEDVVHTDEWDDRLARELA